MITIAFSPHYVEILPFARERMDRHQVIVLEEPPSSGFREMLEGFLSVDEYALGRDSAFPTFERRMCVLLREFHQQGKRIVQVEPYLERLLRIHDLFAEGKTPGDVLDIPELRGVYLSEKHAARALISYYASSVKASFEVVVEAVKAFARADADRITLRSRLRARAIVKLAGAGESIYVEAGYMHYPLYRHLRRELGEAERITAAFLLAPVVKKLGGRRRNLGPGDLLTLHLVLHEGLQPGLADLLAARSLIYVKLVPKEELVPGMSEAPHSEDEVRINRLVDKLQYHDCRTLFGRIRSAKRNRAISLVEDYVQAMSN